MKTVVNIIFVCCCISLVKSIANTLHLMDGTSTAEIIHGDVFFEIVEPEELEYTYRLRPAKDFGAPFNASFHVKNVPLVPILPKFGCKPPDNGEEIEGNVAFVQRGYVKT
ncbi:unnamed protein product [Acanthoscelides obtectus]|uniref:Uncharacterized protein n=1 Tax=Acanthoscelides obtectus TaxID=200917 RepID=A0A9P0KT35_ACAOB|nr:unnamed protein product [Acanthoscelides obtectus]CAK1631922.1 PRADC1-like protein [Acanthoscelides obtectus]